MKLSQLVAAAGIVAVGLAGCTGTSSSPGTPTPTGSASPSPGASAPGDGTLDAQGLAKAIDEAVPTAVAVTALTAVNDPDGIGRPPGSTSSAVISDTGGDQSDREPGVAWGAAVEVFQTAEQAQARSDSIQGIIDDAPVLGREYLTVSGAAVLRVSGELTSSVAEAYEAAFLAAT